LSQRARWRRTTRSGLPFPAAADGRTIEITFIANQIAFDPFDPGHYPIGEIVDAFKVVSIVKARCD
jgi:hypothetical protein